MISSQKLPRPEEIGLSIAGWRPVQEKGLHLLGSVKKRAILLCAPTGSGKSDLAVGSSLISGEPTCIVTASRGLQNQYMDVFKGVGMVDLRGRNNYICGMKPDYTCEDGHVAQCTYKGTVQCPSSQAEMRAAVSSLVVTNYAKWTASKKFGQGMSHFTRVIFDEAHHAPQAIADAMQVELNHKEIEEKLKIPFLDGAEAEDLAEWRAWSGAAKLVATEEMNKAQAKIKNSNDPKPAWVRHFNHMRNLTRRLGILSTIRPTDWIVEEVEQGFKFDPIRPGRYGESALFFRIPKIILISATLRPKTGFMCGISKDNMHFEEFPSDFDPKRCPIYYVPTMRVDSKAGDLGLLWALLDRIAAKRRDVKGIVHTVSYTRQLEIMDRSRFAGSMIINAKGNPASETIEQFKAAGPGTILVSPSVGEGYDFAGDTCRWQLMCKIPFEPPSKILKAREADDPEYRSYQAMQALVQAFGRGMRSKSDWCENFIGDDHLSWFKPRYHHLAPMSFHGFYKEVRVLPPPIRGM